MHSEFTHTRETTVEAMMMCVCILNSQDSFDKSCQIVLRKSIKFSYLLTISSTARRLHVRDFNLPLRAPCTQLRPFSFLPPLSLSPSSCSATPSQRQFEQFALTCCLHNCSTRDRRQLVALIDTCRKCPPICPRVRPSVRTSTFLGAKLPES